MIHFLSGKPGGAATAAAAVLFSVPSVCRVAASNRAIFIVRMAAVVASRPPPTASRRPRGPQRVSSVASFAGQLRQLCP